MYISPTVYMYYMYVHPLVLIMYMYFDHLIELPLHVLFQ